MPVLFEIALLVDFDVVGEDRGETAGALGGKETRVVLWAVDFVVSLVVRVILAEDDMAEGACEVVQMVLFVSGLDVRALEGGVALDTDEAQPFEVVKLAQEHALPGAGVKGLNDRLLTVLNPSHPTRGHTNSELGCPSSSFFFKDHPPIGGVRWQTYMAREALQVVLVSERPHKVSGNGPQTSDTLAASSLQVLYGRRHVPYLGLVVVGVVVG